MRGSKKTVGDRRIYVEFAFGNIKTMNTFVMFFKNCPKGILRSRSFNIAGVIYFIQIEIELKYLIQIEIELKIRSSQTLKK